MASERFEFNRAGFLAGSMAAMTALPDRVVAAMPAGTSPAEHEPSAERLLGRLMAGNKRFVESDFPPPNLIAEKRELLKESQAPFAAILGCSDSRVIPNLIFVQGIGDLFVARVAGNYPDDLVVASIEYAIEHLGTRLVMVLGHQNCGAVKAVYSAIETGTPLPPHLSTIERLMSPGIESVVRAHGTEKAAVEANARAAVAALRETSSLLSSGAKSGHLLLAGAVYQLGSGEVRLLD
jgi:carbonic anhydrase